MQNHRIPYRTATWGIVEEASEPAPFLSVAANRHTTMDAYFYFVRATKFTKNIKKKQNKKQTHRILYSTATWDSVPVVPVAAACVRNAMVNGFETYSKISNMQNHKIHYTTATWGIVEDASEPAPFLSVVAKRHAKMDAYFCFDRASKFTKNIQKSKS